MKLAVLQLFEVVIWGASKDVPLHRISAQAFSEDEAKADGIASFRKTQPLAKIERVEVLSDVHLNPARKQQTLFEDLADACVGHSMDNVQGASVNLLLTAVQRRAVDLADAERRWDELAGRGKEALRRRYSKTPDARDATAEAEIAKRLVG
jgi:hypothetical protein